VVGVSNPPASSQAPAEPAQGDPERRPSARARALRALAVALIVVGALALIDAAVTILWQEPFSALYAALAQDHLEGALRRVEAAPPTPAQRRALASIPDERRRIAYLAWELERHTGDGGAVGRIVIPRIGASFVIVKGTGVEELESGPGIFPETSFPGVGRTTAIAGHRTTFLAPFRHIDALSPGSVIRVQMPYAQFTYAVIGQRVVEPSDVHAAVADIGYSRLVLSACTPLFSAAQRLLVFARLVRTVPLGAARQLLGGGLARPIEARAASRPAPKHLPPVLKPRDSGGFSPIV